MKRPLFIILIILLLTSISLNVFFVSKVNKQTEMISFTNANSRETYFSVHNVRNALKFGKGEGVKVGILDMGFGTNEHEDLYAGGVDFINDIQLLEKISHHGYWMATVLKEIAPKCEVYALNTMTNDEETKIAAMIKAIDWAIENKIDVLTYSSSPISEQFRADFDKAANKAFENNIVTTFIHYDNPNNIWPDGLTIIPNNENSKRKPDIIILAYDYNNLFINDYELYKKLNGKVVDGGNMPYFSISSTSPVAAGFVAILKSVNNELTPKEYKEILVKTSYNAKLIDPILQVEQEFSYIVDISKAVEYLKDNY